MTSESLQSNMDTFKNIFLILYPIASKLRA